MKETGKILFRLLVIVVLIQGITILTSEAQGRGQGKGNCNQLSEHKYEDIPGISKEQLKEIEKLQSAHNKEMTRLRTERRAASSQVVKEQIRQEMDLKVKSNRTEIKALLNDKQQIYFDKYCTPKHSRQGQGRGGQFNKGKRRYL